MATPKELQAGAAEEQPDATRPEEQPLIEAIITRRIRYMTLAEEHADIVRKQGTDIFRKAYKEASEAVNAPPGSTAQVFPPRGTDMTEYYEQFEPTLRSEARTPYEHMYIALVAAGLLAVTNTCDYSQLSWNAMLLANKKVADHFRRIYSPSRNQVAAPLPPELVTETLPIFQPPKILPKLKKLSSAQVTNLLQDFSSLHHKTLREADSENFYKIVDVNYSRTTTGIESFEVQLGNHTSAITMPLEEVKAMLLRSEMVDDTFGDCSTRS